MRELTVAVIAIFAVQFCVALHGQNLKLDLTEVDTGLVVIKTGTVLDSITTDTVVSLGQLYSQTVEMQFKYDSTEHTKVKFDVDGTGEITNVEWKLSDSTSYQDLDTNRYELSEDKKEITLKGCGMYVDDSQLSFPMTLSYASKGGVEGARLSSASVNLEGNDGLYDVFPGEYLLSSKASPAIILLTVMDDCSFGNELQYKANRTANTERLHIETFAVEGSNLLVLKGTDVDVTVNAKTGATTQALGMRTAVAALPDGNKSTLRLMPGMYLLEMDTAGQPYQGFAYEVLNKTARLAPVMYLASVPKVQVGAALDPGVAYLTPTALSLNGEFEPIESENQPLPFAVLKDKLDGGYYLSQRGVFRLRYDERYAENSPLDLRIYDADRVLVPLASPVAREYGTNWIELTLPQGDFVAGEYYVMEVRGPKGDLGLLRFRYEQ